MEPWKTHVGPNIFFHVVIFPEARTPFIVISECGMGNLPRAPILFPAKITKIGTTYSCMILPLHICSIEK